MYTYTPKTSQGYIKNHIWIQSLCGCHVKTVVLSQEGSLCFFSTWWIQTFMLWRCDVVCTLYTYTCMLHTCVHSFASAGNLHLWGQCTMYWYSLGILLVSNHNAWYWVLEYFPRIMAFSPGYPVDLWRFLVKCVYNKGKSNNTTVMESNVTNFRQMNQAFYSPDSKEALPCLRISSWRVVVVGRFY